MKRSSNKKKIACLFPDALDYHLRKCVGKIPYYLYLNHNLDAEIICFQNQQDYPSLSNDTKGLKLSFLSKKLQFIPVFAIAYHLFKYSKTIDYLIIYNQSRLNLFTGWLYKLLNKRGYLIFKADMNSEYLQNLEKSQYAFRNKLVWKYFYNKICNLVCAEYSQLAILIEKMYQLPAEKILLLPNGVDNNIIKLSGLKPNEYREKENIILTVGRIGAAEKNHSLILKAALNTDLNDWKIVFVGNTDPEFRKEFENHSLENPIFKNKIEIIEGTSNYLEIAQWYNKSKIFCLSSNKEGFPLVIPEAMYWGNYVISTPIAALPDILEQGKLGSFFNNEIELTNLLEYLIKNESIIENIGRKSKEKAHKVYVWDKIVAKLAAKMLG